MICRCCCSDRFPSHPVPAIPVSKIPEWQLKKEQDREEEKKEEVHGERIFSNSGLANGTSAGSKEVEEPERQANGLDLLSVNGENC